MSVSTIFLQTTNEGDNEYGDTTFSIHVPVKEKSYKLSVASFMFRPKIILMENQYIEFKFDLNRQWNEELVNEETQTLFNQRLKIEMRTISLKYQITEPLQFNPSKTEVTQIRDIIKGTFTQYIPWRYYSIDGNDEIANGYFQVPIKLEDCLQWSITADYRLQLTIQEPYIITDYLIEDKQNILSQLIHSNHYLFFTISDLSIVNVSPEFQYFSGLVSNMLGEYQLFRFCKTFTAPHTFNPHYWNYITLSCNKSYNTGNVVNQERFNSDIDESSQFYKGQILAYMPNNAYAPEAMQTGMATANEYIIQPADFNSIRFWLNYDNGEPVKLCSPMTIVLNMMPNQ